VEGIKIELGVVPERERADIDEKSYVMDLMNSASGRVEWPMVSISRNTS
jgi:hypothetical protein